MCRKSSGKPTAYLLCIVTLILLPLRSVCSGFQSGQAQERVRTEIPYKEGTAVLQSDFQERVSKTRYRAKGHVEITYQDIVMTCEDAEYDEETREGFTLGPTRFSQKDQWLACSSAEFNFSNQTAVFHDASGFTDRQFLVSGRTILKTGRDTYRIEEGFITACQEKRPKWSMSSSTTNIRVERTARLHNTVFKIKGIPVIYVPYLIVPMLEKERSSGFVPFHYGNSNTKGRTFMLGYFQTLGRSADAMVYGEYFSLRGMAVGGVFRARPTATTHLYVQTYGINDKQGQGGALLVVDGESLLSHDIRAVARVNITSSFQFRQAFADTFRAATIPQERATVYATRNWDSYSVNLAWQRDEVHFSDASLVIRKIPSFEFFSIGKPLGNTPFVFYLQSGIDNMSRMDSTLETPELVQRFDLFPRISARLPSFAGFSLIPSIGVRETYYTSRLDAQTESQVLTKGLNRQYAQFELDLRMPTLERNFDFSWLGSFKHVVEPVVRYRRIAGIDNLHETIRFDEEDAIADTNELEYGFVNRFFRNRKTKPGSGQNFEFLSVALMQKYYFDPTFGGAFREGEANIFYPLDTLTGFATTGFERGLAPVSLITRVSPIPSISHDLRADYDIKFQRVRDVSLATYWQEGKVFVAGTYFRTQALEPGTFDSNQIQGQVGYGSPLRGFSASVTLSYNIRTTTLLNSNSRLNYMWDCCGVAFEFQQYDLGLRTESRFSFSFNLRGIGSFGNVKRPESLF